MPATTLRSLALSLALVAATPSLGVGQAKLRPPERPNDPGIPQCASDLSCDGGLACRETCVCEYEGPGGGRWPGLLSWRESYLVAECAPDGTCVRGRPVTRAICRPPDAPSIEPNPLASRHRVAPTGAALPGVEIRERPGAGCRLVAGRAHEGGLAALAWLVFVRLRGARKRPRARSVRTGGRS